ncbi:hypothetical protein [Parasitella parasitica]|uniref:Uncharacterized protein n=1 Tax=Parasitella parasitica TaxID=35722 RepID=A0A0B7NAU7_9FUNG|nr:hypothetical protein [Parasitella parasitica]
MPTATNPTVSDVSEESLPQLFTEEIPPPPPPIATSLSGKPSANWEALLHNHGITAWHDKLSPSSLSYLGYPICSSIAQRNVAFDKLRDTIRDSINSHSERNLSIRGRATVLNTLIYSKLWMFSASRFSLKRNFLPSGVSTLSQSRANGGVGLLDPPQQQQALQWYWLCPLLLQHLGSPLLARLRVNDVFYLDPDSQVLRVRTSFRQTESRFPTIAKNVAFLVASQQLRFKPYLYNYFSSPPILPPDPSRAYSSLYLTDTALQRDHNPSDVVVYS